MNIPDEFGLFPFQRFTADELRHFFVWCAAHKVSDVDLTGGSPVSVSRFGRRVRCSSATLPTTLMSSLIDELFGREVIPRVLAGNPVDRTIQINGDASGRYGLKRGERIRLPDLHPSTVVALNRRSLQEVFSNDKFRVRRGREALSALMQNRLAVEDKFRSFRPADFADVFRRYPPSGRSPLREKMNGIALILTPDSFIKKEYVD
ncbi:hypothetical protein FCZ07_21660 [Escherichia coli]|nr:hypothetical protein [Escherichia coli]MDN2115588.1 hypothetical protein [Escherichia coli]